MSAKSSKVLSIIGWVLSVLPSLMLCLSASMKLRKTPQAMDMVKSGYSVNAIVPLGAIELASTILFLIPRTSMLGAILLTGYLGGATATHVSAQQAFFVPVAVGVVIWLGLLLRTPKLRPLLPLTH